MKRSQVEASLQAKHDAIQHGREGDLVVANAHHEPGAEIVVLGMLSALGGSRPSRRRPAKPPRFACATCGCEIPPGKAGRRCKECRA